METDREGVCGPKTSVEGASLVANQRRADKQSGTGQWQRAWDTTAAPTHEQIGAGQRRRTCGTEQHHRRA